MKSELIKHTTHTIRQGSVFGLSIMSTLHLGGNHGVQPACEQKYEERDIESILYMYLSNDIK